MQPGRNPNGRTMSAFEMYLRTGKRPPVSGIEEGVEVKFNPWHDPDDGRFTFKGQGTHYAQGGTGRSGGAAGSRRRQVDPVDRNPRSSAKARPLTGSEWRYDPRNPQNHSTEIVRAGDTLAKIAAQRKGVTVDDLAWLNDISTDGVLRVGQKIKLPRQAFLDAGREAKNRFLALDLYMQTHGGKLPPNVAKPPSIEEQLKAVAKTERKNGYSFGIDLVSRTQIVDGELVLDPSEGRSKRNQLEAGKPDRLLDDDGGHFIAVRFRGPRDKFNHFAQERSFNRGRYLKLEDSWAAALQSGKRVIVSIDPEYEGLSRRPKEIFVRWKIDGTNHEQRFANAKEK